MKFINFMMESESAQMVMAEFPYLNPNVAAVEAMARARGRTKVPAILWRNFIM